jgi:hypothetical protein
MISSQALSPEGAKTYQPGATPRVTIAPFVSKP